MTGRAGAVWISVGSSAEPWVTSIDIAGYWPGFCRDSSIVKTYRFRLRSSSACDIDAATQLRDGRRAGCSFTARCKDAREGMRRAEQATRVESHHVEDQRRQFLRRLPRRPADQACHP